MKKVGILMYSRASHRINETLRLDAATGNILEMNRALVIVLNHFQGRGGLERKGRGIQREEILCSGQVWGPGGKKTS